MVQTNVDWNSILSQSAFSFRFAVTVLSPGTPTMFSFTVKLMQAFTAQVWLGEDISFTAELFPLLFFNARDLK